ncbi:hypothetical protein [Streptomyces sp. NPDC093089]|uniref:hypothetical protein n=1 Tax=Streptomyces sp. NPDC093089 TaxID=3366024 RepID=UPI0037FD372D
MARRCDQGQSSDVPATGAAAAQELAASASLAHALRGLADSSYREAAAADSSLADAQRGVASALLWNLRVLAGWLPPAGARLLAAGFEIANVEALLRSFSGASPPPQAYRLGALGTAWRRLERADSADAVRRVLAASLRGDPGAGTAWTVSVGMRIAAAARTAEVGPARTWAEGRVALLTAREMFVRGRVLPTPVRLRAADVLGDQVLKASGFREFRDRLPAGARWAVEGVDGRGTWGGRRPAGGRSWGASTMIPGAHIPRFCLTNDPGWVRGARG